MKLSTLMITIYTDGSTSPGNPGPSGYGFYGTDDLKNEYTGHGIVGINNTNNESELTAVIKALTAIKDQHYDNKAKQSLNVNIVSDSKYVVDNIKMLTKWERNNWLTSTGTPVANITCWNQIKLLIDCYKLLDWKLTFTWVKGHNGTQGNEMADKLANKGRLLVIEQSSGKVIPQTDIYSMVSKEENIIPAETIIKTVANKESKSDKLTPLLTGKKWFFYTNSPTKLADGRYFYTTSTYKEAKPRDANDEKAKNQGLARRNPDTHYSILISKDPIVELDHLRDQFDTSYSPNVSPVVVNLATLTKPDYWKLAQDQALNTMHFKGIMATMSDSTPIGSVIFPPKLIFKLEDIYKYGFQLLDHYEKSQDRILIIDITDQIFQQEKNKRIINPSFINGSRTLDVLIDTDKIVCTEKEKECLQNLDKVTLNLGIDLPTRNNFNALIKDKNLTIKISLLVFELTDCSFRLATLVDCGDRIGIYYNPDANYRILSIPF